MASPVPISPLSAALTIIDWMSAHSGREPRVRDTMVSGNGLLFYSTYFKRLPGDTFSAVISAARAMVSTAPRVRMQTCLGSECTARFAYTGSHFCENCRIEYGYAHDVPSNGQHLHKHDREDAARGPDMALLTIRELRDYGLEDDLVDWSGERGPQGFDDMVASQMNRWERLSRKRRFFGSA